MNGTRNLRQLAATLTQPQWIAAILSLGFHGVLFAAGPSFSSLNMNALGGDLPEQEQRQVPLIELTPEEQNRLPDFSSSAYSLFPEESDPFELFPPSGSSLPLNPLPDVASDPILPAPKPSPPPSGGSVAVGIAPYNSPSRPSILFPPRQAPQTAPPGGPTFSNGVPVPRVDRTPAPAPENEASTSTTVIPDNYDGPTAADLGLNRPGAQPETEDSAPLNASSGETPGENVPNPLQAQLESLAYQPENTTDDEAEAAIEIWQAALEERLPGELEAAPDAIEIQLSYIQRLCLDPEPADGLLGLVALPAEEGEDLELFPTVLKSTGYPFLNQEAIATLNDLKAPTETDDSEGSTAVEPGVMYQVVVDVDYDQESCINRETLLEEIKANQAESANPEATPAPVESNQAAPSEEADVPAPDEPSAEQEPPEPTPAPDAEDSESPSE